MNYSSTNESLSRPTTRQSLPNPRAAAGAHQAPDVAALERQGVRRLADDGVSAAGPRRFEEALAACAKILERSAQLMNWAQLHTHTFVSR